MTGALSYAAALEHTEDLQRAAKERRKGRRSARGLPRRPLLPRLPRPRLALTS